MLFKIVPSEKGNAFVSVFVLMAMVGLAASVYLDFMRQTTNYIVSHNRTRNVMRLRDKIELSILSNLSCTCQVDSAVNLAFASVLSLDLSRNPIPEIDLEVWRAGCDFSDPENILVKVGQAVSGSPDLTIRNIKISKMEQKGPDRVDGVLSIGFNSTLIRPIEFEIKLVLDPATPPSSRRMQSCLRSQYNISTCPSGFVMLGRPDEPATSCIERSERVGTFFQALGTCYNLRPSGFSFAHICSSTELMLACRHGIGLENINNGPEMQSSAILLASQVMISLTNPDCTGSYGVPISGTYPYRCCLK